MSFLMEDTADSYTPTDSWEIGPQTDGTNQQAPIASTIPSPFDTAGGSTGNYGADVLNVFKLGVGVVNTLGQGMLDYKRYEATAKGTWVQGQTATIPKAATGKASSTAMIAGVLVLVLLIATHKG